MSALAVLAVSLAVNLKGTEETGLFQIVVTGLKVALIILFLYGGLQGFDASVVANSLAEILLTDVPVMVMRLTSTTTLINLACSW